jgi:hypothetical protein
VAYSTDLADLLTDQLQRFATLNRHQIAGHVANLEFWLAEVRHCLSVIDDYGPRFERMKDAQSQYVLEHGTINFALDDPCCIQQSAPQPRRVPHSELRDSRRSLCDATYHFLVRCYRERLLSEQQLRSECEQLQISVAADDLMTRSRY